MSDSTTKVEITPLELKSRLECGDDLLLLDVREPHELKISCLPGILNIPMGELMDRIDELMPSSEKEIVVICRAGNRSGVIADFMRDNGFPRCLNLVGGMNLWSDTVDPTVAKY